MTVPELHNPVPFFLDFCSIECVNQALGTHTAVSSHPNTIVRYRKCTLLRNLRVRVSTKITGEISLTSTNAIQKAQEGKGS